MGALSGRLLLAGVCKGPRGPWGLPDGSRVDELCPGWGQSFHLHLLQQGAPALLQHHTPLLQKIQVTKGTLLRYMKVLLWAFFLFFFSSSMSLFPWLILIWACSHCTAHSLFYLSSLHPPVFSLLFLLLLTLLFRGRRVDCQSRGSAGVIEYKKKRLEHGGWRGNGEYTQEVWMPLLCLCSSKQTMWKAMPMQRSKKLKKGKKNREKKLTKH